MNAQNYFTRIIALEPPLYISLERQVSVLDIHFCALFTCENQNFILSLTVYLCFCLFITTFRNFVDGTYCLISSNSVMGARVDTYIDLVGALEEVVVHILDNMNRRVVHGDKHIGLVEVL